MKISLRHVSIYNCGSLLLANNLLNLAIGLMRNYLVLDKDSRHNLKENQYAFQMEAQNFSTKKLTDWCIKCQLLPTIAMHLDILIKS